MNTSSSRRVSGPHGWKTTSVTPLSARPGEPLADLVARPAHRHLVHQLVAARLPGRLVGLVEAHAVLRVDREVALLRRRLLDHRLPLRAARHLLERLPELVGAVVRERQSRPAGRAHAVGVELLVVVADRAPEQVGDPLELRGELGHRERDVEAVAQVARDGGALGAERRDDDRDVDGSIGAVSGRMQHPHARALPTRPSRRATGRGRRGCTPP
jgi:hypothetical protein